MKQKSTFMKVLMTLLLLLGASGVWAGEVTFTGAAYKGKGGKSGTGGTATATLDRITISSTKAYYSTDTEIREYSGGTITVSASETQITKIEILCKNGYCSFTSNPKALTISGTTAIWEGTASSITFTTTAQCRWESIKVTYSSSTSGPSISCTDITDVSYEGISNATTTASFSNADGWTPSISAIDGTVVTSASISGTTVTYSVSENTGSTNREGSFTIKLSKDGETDVTKEVKVSQLYQVIDYAMLPFNYDGGKSNLPNGLTHSGLGSDYSSSPKLKFDSTGDYLVLKINEEPGELKFDIKGNGFADGTFKVQTSVDGTNYSDLASYTSLSDVTTETFTNIASTVRYIKWIYTSKSSGNVAIGKISFAKAVNADYWVVKYDANGGTGAPDDEQVTKGESITISTTEPTRVGYDFAGWTLIKDGTDVVTGSYTPIANVTLYAKWNAKDIDLTASAPVGGTYTVKIGDTDPETISSTQTLAAKAGTTIVMTSTASEGYKIQSTPFTVTDGSGTDVKVSKSGENYSFTMPGTATTIVANYSVLYTITTASCINGSITKIADKDGYEITAASKNSKVVVTATPDARYTVHKLYFVEEGSTAKNDFTANGYFTMPEKNVTVYAEFEECNDLVFDFTTDSHISGWPTASSNTVPGNKYYDSYAFDLGATVYYQSMGTDLMIKPSSYLGLPALEGYKLTKVVGVLNDRAKNAESDADWNVTTTAVVSIKTANNGSVVSGGTAQTWSTKGGEYTYNLTGTEANTSYYLCVATGNCQIKTLTLSYEPVIKTQDVEITSAGYATACIPFASTVEGATAYYVTVDDGKAILNKIEGTIPAETGVVLEGEEGTATFTLSTNTPESVDGNLLVGTTEAGGKTFSAETGTTYYILSNGANGVGFYYDNVTQDNGASAYCNQYKAVLAVPTGSGAPSFFTFDDATAINGISSVKASGVRYNLNGQAVGENYKGIVIVNGKKMFNK